MSPDSLHCPLCSGSMPVVGKTTVFSGTPVAFCRACDLYRVGPLTVAHSDPAYRAGYTRRSLERLWLKRRDGFYRYLLRLIDRSLPPGRSAPVLVDFGSCYGHLLVAAAEHGYRGVGVEVNPELVAMSRRWGLSVVTSIDAVPAGVDVITFIDSFYYVERPHEVLSAARSKLREGGFLLLRMTNRNWLATLHRRFAGEDLSLLGDALFSYSPRALRTLLESSGFVLKRIVADRGVGKSLGWPKRAAYALLQLLTTLSANRLALTPGIIAIAAPREVK